MVTMARKTMRLEAEAILAMAERLDGDFVRAVELLRDCRGRVVVTGMGKSGLIGKKLAATLASTGTPALFLHPAEGSHGDLGMVTTQDCLVAVSNSGETTEVVALLPVIKRLGIPLVSLLGRRDSTLGRQSDVVLDVAVGQEACPLGLAPTCSTTAALAMGDALAVVLLEARGFGPEQFALLHPGGSLGRRLLWTVGDLMHTGAAIPLVAETTDMQRVILEMTAKRFGMTGVTSETGRLTGIITDGDLRRLLERGEPFLTRSAGEVMTRNPRHIAVSSLAAEAVRRMQEAKITSLFCLEGEKLVGVIHLHDLLKAGVV
ncbi:MAG: KpsF/GutQ family sugar-phosphate isomerase [Magnetococcales bacterium]|nr:KpsF/GutQ family sugar-phosphate isomerase [Magnetococcales bacterium]